MRMMVIDKDPVVLETVEIYLLSIGCDDLHFARSAAEALRALQTSFVPFDCVLLDHDLPRITPLEMVRRVRGTPGHGQVRVILLSTPDAQEGTARASIAGATGCLMRPFDVFDLKSCIAAGIGPGAQPPRLITLAGRRRTGRGVVRAASAQMSVLGQGRKPN